MDVSDDFVTPSSTPPTEMDDAEPTSEEPSVFTQDLSDAAIHDKIYDKYDPSVRLISVVS